MGSFNSKLSKQNCSNASEETSKLKHTIQITDPRSPTGEIVRTPITIDKDKGVIENMGKENEKEYVLKHRLMKNLKLDPRSPTDGINRTPIILENTPAQTSNKGYGIFESPLSIYSHNFSDLSTLTDLRTPTEPSVNVSGFERDSDSANVDTSKIDSEKYKSDEISSEITKTPLKVSSKPSTAEARKILNEILTSKESENVVSDNKIHRPQKNKSLSVHKDYSENKVSEKKKEKLKCRTPLSNITLSNNSSNYVNSVKKPYARCRILSDVGLENSGSPKVKQIAEWDKDKTVII